MQIFESIFGRPPADESDGAPRSAETPAIDKVWPKDIRRALTRQGFSEHDARRAYEILFDVDRGVISVAVDAGKDVYLTGLGKFTRRERTAGRRRNPKTGEWIEIPASNYPAFKTSPRWKRKLNA